MSDISRDALHAVFTESGTRPAPLVSTRKIMGGSATITLVGAGLDTAEACWSYLAELEALWSRFIPTSDIMRLNWSEGSVCDVDPRTITLIEEMREGYRRTGGDFDPTLLPSVIANGYSTSLVDPTRTTRLPDSASAPGDLASAHIDGNRVTLPKGTTLDPGGVGKGLAADLTASRAMEEGAWGVMVEVAGDIRVAGESPDGIAWRLGVENPFVKGMHSDIVRLRDAGVVTSSQRKRRFGNNKQKHHLINPATHESAETSAQTVTVIAATAAKAETLTKPGFLRPTTEYLDWLPAIGAAGLVIDALGEAHESTNWSDYR